MSRSRIRQTFVMVTLVVALVAHSVGAAAGVENSARQSMRRFVTQVEAYAHLRDDAQNLRRARAEAQHALTRDQSRAAELQRRQNEVSVQASRVVALTYANRDTDLGILAHAPVDVARAARYRAATGPAIVEDLVAIKRARAVLNATLRDEEAAIDALSARIDAVEADAASVLEALGPAQDAALGVLRAEGHPARAVRDVTVSIQGAPELRPGELIEWYQRTGARNATGVPIEEIVGTYYDEGDAEHVRGDLAFLQAIIETGGFSAMSGSHNFAGIGACDGCGAGFDFATLQLGVRAQIQYLKAYSVADFSAATLARPAVPNGLDTLSVRGCCTTWYGLTGTWASAVSYGGAILGLYEDLLDRRTQPASSS